MHHPRAARPARHHSKHHVTQNTKADSEDSSLVLEENCGPSLMTGVAGSVVFSV